MPELKPGWRRVKFGEIAENVNDRVDHPSQAGVDRYVGLEHLDPDNLTIRRWGTPDQVESTKLRFRPGDIIFGKRRAYQRKLAVADFDGICSAHAMVLRAKPGAVVPEFLPFFMQSDTFMERAQAISVGSLSPTINWKTLAAEEFDLPSIQEQEKLSMLLSALEALRRRSREATERFRDVRLRIYVDATISGVRGAPTKSTPIGKIPTHWEIAPLREAVVIENTLRKPINAVERSRKLGPYPYFGPTGVLDHIDEYRFKGRYMLIGEDGDHFLKWPTWSMTQLVDGRFNVNNHAHAIRGTDKCLTDWVFHFFRHRSVKEWLTKQGAGRLKLKKSTLERIPLPIPPLDEQRELIHLFEDLDARSADLTSRERRSAALLKNALTALCTD
jgi:type I restriction enzyme S subunit